MPSNPFNSTYPILAMAMNQVSDAKFGVACAKAGLIPSISAFSYSTKTHKVEYKRLIDDLLMFQRSKFTGDVLFSMYEPHIYDDKLIKILKAASINKLEIIMPWHDYDMFKFGETLTKLQGQGFTLFQRAVQYDPAVGRPARNGYWFKQFDGVIAKGNKGAGAVTEQSLEDMISAIKKDYPHLMIIAAGGISLKEHVDKYLTEGVVAVGIGTLIAASKESGLSQTAKQKLVDGEFDTANTLPNKNAIVFKHIDNNDTNHTLSLKIGLHRPDLGGHIYIGEGINNIKSIRSLKDIVADLV